jgi:hypothetical protein
MATSSISAMRMPRSHPSYRARVSPSRASPASNRMRVAATASSKKVLVPIGEGYVPPHRMRGVRNTSSTTILLVLLHAWIYRSRQRGYIARGWLVG